MHILFIHQNFPAQFRYLAPRLVRAFDWRCTFATRNGSTPDLPGVERLLYTPRGRATALNHPCTRGFENQVGHAHGAYDALKARPDIRPDLVVAHSGFGSSLFVPQLYDAPIINFFEYFYRVGPRSIAYRPEATVRDMDLLRCRADNAMLLLDLDNCDRGWCPNRAQRDCFPTVFHPKLEVLPDGIDTALWTCATRASGASASARVLPDGTSVPRGTRIVTFVSRGLELMRGFDIFMRVAKRIYDQFPEVVFVVVGEDKAHYACDRKFTGGSDLRTTLLASGNYDLRRFHFTGRIPAQDLAQILALSDLHIYLTVPFVTSWSLLNAMSCGCVVIASDQDCTREYVRDGETGILCDFFDVDGITRQALRVLRDPAAFRHLGDGARRTIEDYYSLDVALPRIREFFERVASKKRAPSARAELLVRNGAGIAGVGAVPQQGPRDKALQLPAFDGSFPFHPHRVTGAVTAPREGVNGAPKTVLFAWEFGHGLGHLMQMLPLAEDLARAGHCVVVALRDLSKAVSVFGRAGVHYLQAPSRPPGPGRFPCAPTFTPLLANLGFGDDGELFGIACAWRNLIRTVAPDLVVFDYAPTALLASRAFSMRRAVIGSGFCCPPDSLPADGANGVAPLWGVLRPAAAKANEAALRAVEADVLGRVNWVLENWGEAPLSRIGQLFGDADETFLTTLPELDHFPDRRGAGYWGPVLQPVSGGKKLQWPDGSGRRVFVYLKASPVAEEALLALKQSGCPTLAYVDGVTRGTVQRVKSPTLKVSPKRLDVAAASRECDVVVVNGGHGVVAEMLLAGKPVLTIPTVLEQQKTTAAVLRLGAGISASSRDVYSVAPAVEAILGDEYERCADGARRFAQRYAAFDRVRQRLAMFQRVIELLGGLPPEASKSHPIAVEV